MTVVVGIAVFVLILFTTIEGAEVGIAVVDDDDVVKEDAEGFEATDDDTNDDDNVGHDDDDDDEGNDDNVDDDVDDEGNDDDDELGTRHWQESPSIINSSILKPGACSTALMID